jgi:uncharacterized membrane protein YgdD (TMEM256/DUF423 family)
MERKIALVALLLGFLAIVLGAFGAHALKKYLTEAQLVSFETAVKYQMYHALFLLFVSQTNLIVAEKKQSVFLLIITGVILFSGSIYLLTTTNITNIKTKILGPITPIGGLLLIAGWILMFYNIFAKKS